MKIQSVILRVLVNVRKLLVQKAKLAWKGDA